MRALPALAVGVALGITIAVILAARESDPAGEATPRVGGA